MLRMFRYATQQALINVQWLQTTSLLVLQALVLFLIPARYAYEPQTYWILTGAASRIGQRIGVFGDGEDLDLRPFDVEMRLRLYMQLVPLDGIAAQMSGADLPIVPASWNSRPPSNRNDNQIWSEMKKAPPDQDVATDMIFCLTRGCVGRWSVKLRQALASGQDYHEIEPLICEAEKEMEDKYIRYCDTINPLHFLAVCLARSLVTAFRLQARLPKIRDRTATRDEKLQSLQLVQKLLDTDIATNAHQRLKRHSWYFRSFFVMGSWDSLIFVLTTLQNPGILPHSQVESAWGRVQQLYTSRGLLDSQQALYMDIRHLTLKAWMARPSSDWEDIEPEFIVALCTRHESKRVESDKQGTTGSTSIVTMPGRNTPLQTIDDSFDTHDPGNGLPCWENMNWESWNKLVKDCQMQGGSVSF